MLAHSRGGSSEEKAIPLAVIVQVAKGRFRWGNWSVEQGLGLSNQKFIVVNLQGNTHHAFASLLDEEKFAAIPPPPNATSAHGGHLPATSQSIERAYVNLFPPGTVGNVCDPAAIG